MSENEGKVVIIGANLAGGRTAGALRSAGYNGQIILVGEEPEIPYERPPLSKNVLIDPSDLPIGFYIYSREFYDENKIDLKLGVRAIKVTVGENTVELCDGEIIKFDNLVFCTGARVRKLNIKGSELDSVHYLRTFDDSKALSSKLGKGKKIVLIGMGVIGAEVAASAKKMGCSVVAIDPQPVPMVRALGEEFGSWLAGIHREEGVDLRLGVQVEEILGKNGKVSGVRLNNGQTIVADIVVIGIGVVPNIELAKDAGLDIDNGIAVNAYGKTSLDHIYAAGDVTSAPQYFGGRKRLETYENAQEQAIAVAKSIAGTPKEYLQPSWFWSDQFDLNIQVLGDIISEENVERVIIGDMASRSFSAFFIKDERIQGVFSVNQAKEMSLGRRMMLKQTTVTAAELRQPDLDLKALSRRR